MARRSTAILLASLLASAALLSAPAVAQAAPASSGRTVHSTRAGPSVAGPTGRITTIRGWCLDVSGGNTTNGTPLQAYQCNGTPAQQWTVGTDGTLRALGKCMDVYGGLTNQNVAVQLYDCNGSGAQQWAVHNTDMLINPQSGLCLWTPGYGLQLRILRCLPGGDQEWRLPA
ncbi:ricin-type beta-trefoil lectin domain protein [Kitasatospora kifunensis]|uniref:Ricin B lectin domain-containing protein n=1 Tax=Kitasatospora kifunensis TaxID=58351 RepID=A0A7W7VSR6_KITKI|nr:ricin-type beta-trefoil lectin domain protein [Kitasatospora kifunensis]MBB4921013.1 hypothetical protein [Kitasatospora kifunensis]